MTRPLAVDGFCGAGGAAQGYADAGFAVVGVDIEPQPRYPFEFIRGDVFDVVPRLLAERDVALLHGSCPCQAYSDLQRRTGRIHPKLIEPFRRLAREWGGVYLIENVEGAPLIDPVRLCGAMFGLRTYRHRLFESNVALSAPEHPAHRWLTFTHDKRKAHYGRPMSEEMFVQVTGGGNATVAEKRKALGIDWMLGRELNEAIPPAYTRFLGGQLLAHLSERMA